MLKYLARRNQWAERLMYAIQRFYRGYDDRTLWQLNDVITDHALVGIDYMIKKGSGYPSQFKNNSEWTAVLRKMKKAFKLRQDDLNCFNPKAKAEIKEGMRLFVKHIDSLWD